MRCRPPSAWPPRWHCYVSRSVSCRCWAPAQPSGWWPPGCFPCCAEGVFMDARLQDLPFDPAALNRLSPGLITSHHQNNHGGAVKRLNAIRAQLATTVFATAPGFQLNGLKREEIGRAACRERGEISV